MERDQCLIITLSYGVAFSILFVNVVIYAMIIIIYGVVPSMFNS